jgi:hypothetical protein
LETFAGLKELVENPLFQNQKKQILSDLTDDMLDPPMVDLVSGFNALSCCFTLQCCYGHFVYGDQDDPENLEALPQKDISAEVKYRIAYIAFCIENSHRGKALFKALKDITAIDPRNIQFCCADWFWERQINSYALQVEPDRFKHRDTAVVDFREALHIEKIRNIFFIRLHELLDNAKGT